MSAPASAIGELCDQPAFARSGTKTLSQSHDGEMNSDREDEVIHKYTDRSSTNMMMP